MSHRSRRTLLQTVGAAVLLAVAGCLDAPTDPDDSTAVVQLGPSFTEPAWSTAPTDDVGYVARYDSRDALESLLGSAGETPDRVTNFVEATDFDAATILYVQSVGPSTCYSKLDVSNVSVTDEAIVATASAVDTSGSDAVCGQAITYPSAFVRVTGDDLPEATRVTLTSGFGTTGTVTPTATAADGDR